MVGYEGEEDPKKNWERERERENRERIRILLSCRRRAMGGDRASIDETDSEQGC
jgi:hypothetical protein